MSSEGISDFWKFVFFHLSDFFFNDVVFTANTPIIQLVTHITIKKDLLSYYLMHWTWNHKKKKKKTSMN